MSAWTTPPNLLVSSEDRMDEIEQMALQLDTNWGWQRPIPQQGE